MKAFVILWFSLLSAQCIAQNGLEKISVEKYYISNEKDAETIGGKLPIGSVTYRVFVDLLPQYRFQAAYGIPGHDLTLSTTTKFFNNEDKGASIPNVIPDRSLQKNTVMLDSWLSVGAASEGNYGILKTSDDETNTVKNSNGNLQNDNPEVGIPLSKRDGLIAGNPPRVTVFGIDSALNVFNSRTNASVFHTNNGSWASLHGSVGPDSLSTNRILIGQFTTDGVFKFELNIQIGTPYGGVENYVARNPTGGEIEFPELIFDSEKSKSKKGKLK